MPLSLLMPQQIAQLPGQLLTEIVQDTTQGLGNMLTGAQTTTQSMLTQNNNAQGPVERLRLIQCDRHQSHSHVYFIFLVYVGYEKKCCLTATPKGLGNMLTGTQTTTQSTLTNQPKKNPRAWATCCRPLKTRPLPLCRSLSSEPAWMRFCWD